VRGTFEISEFSDLCIEFVLRLRMQLKRSATSHDLYISQDPVVLYTVALLLHSRKSWASARQCCVHYIIRAQLTQMLHLQVKPTRRPSLVSWNFYHVPSHNHPPHKRPGHRRLYVAIRRAILEPCRVNLQSVKRLRLAVARTAAHCCAVGG